MSKIIDFEPNFNKLEATIMGDKDPDRVHFAELQFDPEPISELVDRLFDENIPSYFRLVEEKIGSFKDDGEVVLLDSEKEKEYVDKIVKLAYTLGYDYVPDVYPAFTLYAMIMPVTRVGEDTADLSRGERDWVEEGAGVITSWEDFEDFHWDKIELKNLEG